MQDSIKYANTLGHEATTEVVFNRHFDPHAPYDATQAAVLSDAGFSTAHRTISAWPGYAPTPLLALPGIAAEAGVATLHYKDEGGRFGLGSFKALGGAYAVLRLLAREIATRKGIDEPSVDDILDGTHADVISDVTVCCATDGNHGRSVAWGAQTFGCNCVIFIHGTVSEGRKTAIEAFGADVRRCAGNYDDSVREADKTARAEGWFVVSDTSYPGYTEIPKDVMQGYEVMAAEAAEQLGEAPTHVFLQTGVGGVAAAVAAQMRRRYGSGAAPRFILADPEDSACWLETIRAGTPTAVEGELDTLMAGLACGEVSVLAWDVLKPLCFAVASVADADAVAMMRRLARPLSGDPPVVAGESAVAGLAAFLSAANHAPAREALGIDETSRVLVFGTEADTDPELYTELVGKTADEVRAAA
ncbi:diaminopropionate ammonia-lyase [Tropicimonas isoalkanivorans]|uniref:Diaminopropionate ammonia-lyase n=1 Tax=Tropicimonas isoalkanivorans TaxID=441112 RepID=A0A1I1DIZ8_9RHOB|nr:diaminopropionate ammonia-lyase [Tropicimonas isoalkanivorans]SFB74342.1 diaminopropionate ammonia-lyase [Tropicimonas isoalkanivorans]